MARVAEAAGLRRFTVDEYHRMAEAGILGEEDRVELIRGVIRKMSPNSRPQVVATTRTRVVDIQHRVLHVFRDPRDGAYRTRTTHKPGSRIAPMSWPDFEIDVDSLFPSEAASFQ